MKTKRSNSKRVPNRARSAGSHERLVRERIVNECASQVPYTWLDDLLTGPKAVLKGNGGNWGCPDIERLLNAIKARILALSNQTPRSPFR